MKRLKVWLLACAVIAGGSCFLAQEADAGIFGRGYRTYSKSGSQYRSRYGGARPVTGIGLNFHRRAVLKQEAKRARQGKSVRNRGNILWYR